MAEKKLTINNGNGNPDSPIIVEGVVNTNQSATSQIIKFWRGTKTQYDNIPSAQIDANTVYFIIEDK